MRRIARSTYRWIYGGGLVLLFLGVGAAGAIGGVVGSGTPPMVLAGAWWVWLLFGRRIAFHLVPLFVSRIRCPGCGEEHEARGVWNCHCGFKDYRERHLLSLKCPKCGEYTAGFDCPTCGATILLW